MRTRAERRHSRESKAWRRIKADRASHHHDVKRPPEQQCACFLVSDRRHNGLTLSRFADNPQMCSSPGCCGNPRRRGELTLQEQRAQLMEDEE